MRGTTFTYIILFAFGLAACSSKTHFSNDKELAAYISDPDNGFIQKAESPDFIYEAKLVPPLDNDSVGQSVVHFRISLKDGSPVLTYGGATTPEAVERENYFSFGMGEDVWLETGGTIYYSSLNHYERTYGLRNPVDILFHFPAINAGDAVYFVWDDPLFDQPKVRIKFDKNLFTTCHVEK